MRANKETVNATEKLAAITNASKPFKVSISVMKITGNSDMHDTAGLYIGDAVKIRFESECDAYLTLIDIGTSGNAHIIVPNLFNIDNFVKGGREIYLPEGDMSVAAMIQGPPGVEVLKALVTKQPINLFDIDFNNFSNTSLNFSEAELEKKVDKITKKLSKESTDSWCDALCEFHIKAHDSIPPTM